MMRFCVVAVAAMLAGCVGAEPGRSGPPIEEQAAPPTPDDVVIQHRIDLSEGLSETTWTLQALEGYSSGHATARLEPMLPAGPDTGFDFCFRYQVSQSWNDGNSSGSTNLNGGQCSTGVNVQIGGTNGGQTLADFSGGSFAPGSYRFTARSAPQLAYLVIDMVATY